MHILLVLIIAAAVLNLAVAWALAFWLAADETRLVRMGNFPTNSGDCLTFFVMGTPWAQRVDWIMGREVARTAKAGEPGRMAAPWWCWVPGQVRFQSRQAGPLPSNLQWIEGASGWPLPALRWCLLKQKSGAASSSTPVGLAVRLKDVPAPVRGGAPRLRVLGVEPFWPGLLINIALYAATLWLLLQFPSVLRRSLRIRRRLCPACAYPVGASPVCTECGKAIPNVLRRHSSFGSVLGTSDQMH